MVSQPDPQPELQRVLPDSADLHLQLQHHRHLTLQLAWEEYRHQHPDGYRYSYFCELYQQWRRKQDVVLRQQQKAGEKLFVDWAGATIPIHDRHSGQARPASLFVAAVGASSYTYAEAIRDYFTDHLPRLRGSSPRTIHSYRDSIAMLLHYFSGQRGKAITQLDPTDVDPPSILAFLSYLEKEWKNGVPTRNVRLSAIHAFFHFVASRNPEHLGLAQRVLGILFRRTRQRVIDYLEYEEIDSILKAINRTTAQGARDYARLATMFNTGARAQEIADLRIRDLQLVKPFQVRLFGEGKKERYFPIWPQTATVLRAFCKGRDGGGEQHNADSLDRLSSRGSWPGRSCPRRDCR